MSKSKYRSDKIADAIKILTEAAQSKSRPDFADDFEAIKDFASEFFPDLKEGLKQKAKQAKESGEEIIEDFEQSVKGHLKNKPWHVLGAVALGGLLLGVLLGRRR